jgi:cytochrome P450
VNADFAIGGKMIPKGSTISLVIGAANRDPKIFDNPEVLDITRTPNRHLTFGSGIHYCMGDWLARRQGQLGIMAILDRFKDLTYVEGTAAWNNILTFRSLKSMAITVR